MKISLTLVVVFLACAISIAQSSEPSLGEVAKQKAAKKAAKTVTDEDMPQHPKAAASPTAATVAKDASDSAKPAADKPAADAKATAPAADPYKNDPPKVADARAKVADLKATQATFEFRVKRRRQQIAGITDATQLDIQNGILADEETGLQQANSDLRDAELDLEKAIADAKNQ